MYRTLIHEEYTEWVEAAEEGNYPHEYKELGDLLWVILQYANTRGWNMARCLGDLIAEYNSKFYTKEGKFEPKYREDGKLMKNTGFKPMDIITSLREAKRDHDLYGKGFVKNA